MILTTYASAQRHNRPQGYAACYCITSRQVRNACVLGCLGGFAFIAFACWALS